LKGKKNEIKPKVLVKMKMKRKIKQYYYQEQESQESQPFTNNVNTSLINSQTRSMKPKNLLYTITF
jgi:hypothetical protein